MTPADVPPTARRLRERVDPYAPGIAVAVVVSLAAYAIGARYQAPVMLFALLLGMAMSFLTEDDRIAQGVRVMASTGLKLGVALMGLRVSFDVLADLGAGVLVVLVLGSGSTILIGVLIGRALGWGGSRAVIAAGAVAICGASAALALASVTRTFKGKEDHTLVVIMSATALSTIAMIFYPLILGAMGFDHKREGLILGASIHDVAQVIGAGFSVSEEAGETATLSKMARVSMLPLVLLMVPTGGAAGTGRRIHLPWFVVAFVVLMLVNQFVALPSVLTDTTRTVSGALLITAVAALGLGSAPRKLLRTCGPTFAVMGGLSVWLLAVAVIGVSMIAG